MTKEIKLVGLSLKNFKGVRNFSFDSQGENVKVYGDNATGKTTLFDAFVWLLFDKDSQNKKDFQLKTLTKDGKTLHGQEHEVEGIFFVDNKQLVLKKVFTEKWTKKRGSADKQFTGHSTDYYIDGVPSKKKEFTDHVDGIVNEEIFKLLTSPSYFNDQLHWQKRRAILLEVCGDVTDEDVISSNPNLSPLPAILNGRSLEDHRKVIIAKRSEINKELDRIPIRIDEVGRSVEDVSDLDQQELKKQIETLQALVSGKEEELKQINNGSQTDEKQRQIREIEFSISELRNEHKQQQFGEINKLQSDLYEQKNRVNSIKNNIQQKRNSLQRLFDDRSDLEMTMETLRKQWAEKNGDTFDNHQTTCPTCKQDLPEAEIQKAVEQFNLHKSEQLESISQRGKQKKQLHQDVSVKINMLEDEIDKLSYQIKKEEEAALSLQTRISELQTKTTAFEDTEEYLSKQKLIDGLKSEIQQLRTSSSEVSMKVQSEIRNIKGDITAIQTDLAKFDQVKKAELRVVELEKEEKDLAAEFEKLEQELYLTEEFIRTKVSLLEERINSKFKYAKFKLFEPQINGGLQETCETLYQGVPYESGLNNAARINVGLDIIDTLSDHYDVRAPIFVDNSEAVTKLIDIDSQVISLVVSEKDKKLRVEYQNEVKREAI